MVPSPDPNLQDFIMNILLIGANFKNKGAEAMALTAIRELSERFPDATFTVASYAAREALPYGEHTITIRDRACTFRLIRNQKSLSTALRILGAALSPTKTLRARIARGNPYLESIASGDIVIDISGFALTDKRPLHRRVVFVAEILTAKIFRKPFVVFTQAVGPFTQLSTRLLAKIGLPLADLVCARGESTVKHLEALGIEKRTRVIRCADSAYLFSCGGHTVAPELIERKPQGQPIIGIVPNTNVFDRAKTIDGVNSYTALLAATIDHGIEKLNARVVFICHEHYEGRKDDQWLAHEAVRHATHGTCAQIISGNHTAADLKRAIGNVDLLIASRFHSLVAANSLAVPSIALAWAHKYHELFAEAGIPELVFDGEDLVVSEFIPHLDRAWNRRNEIAETLRGRQESLRSSARQAFDAVAEMIRGNTAPRGESPHRNAA
jgi:colanic acid/amylovoran biosynthesis protein